MGWKESEVGFRNDANECYMIALVQMLGTARRVRDAIGRLPVPVVGEQSLDARVTKVLRHDFVLKGKPSQASQLCYSGKHCHLFTEGQRIEKPLKLGKQLDAEEALHHVLHAWATLDGTASVAGRIGYLDLGVTKMHQLFRTFPFL